MTSKSSHQVSKYITVNGIHKLNPAWQGDANNHTLQPFQNRHTALAVVSYPSQQNIFAPEDEEIVVAPSYQHAAEEYQNMISDEAEMKLDEGNHHHGLGPLSSLLAKYEVPAGMLSKLLGIRNFSVAEMIVDDSSSMNAATDATGLQGKRMTRWHEAKWRILQMMELLAYISKAPRVYVRFLNRGTFLVLERAPDESPQVFFQRVASLVEQEFAIRASGSTPALERIRESLTRYPTSQPTLRYFLGDGVPNGAAYASKQIAQLLVQRAEPEKNPFTFMSCTNQDSATEWMKECEEIAPYCSEFDDYMDESREILKDQGKAFPYSYGLHLVAQIVAAFNPHDLDAMDESVPFTKPTLQDILGYQLSDPEYKYYFDSFLEAQHKKLNLSPIQRSFVLKLPELFLSFSNTPRATAIPAVTEYKQRMKTAAVHQNQAKTAAYPPSGQQAECCTIL